MKSVNGNVRLFEQPLKAYFSDSKITRENSNGSNSAMGNTRRPTSLDPRLAKAIDRRSVEDVLNNRGQRTKEESFIKATKGELEDAIRSYHNRSLSPQLTNNKVDKATKRTTQDLVRRSQNRSVSPQLMHRGDSKGSFVNDKEKIDEWKEHQRHIKEKHESGVNLPVILTSPLSNNLTAKIGPSSPSYNKENRPPKAVFQAFQPNKVQSDSDYGSSPELRGSPSYGGDTEGGTDDELFDINFPISTYPNVENSELSRHKYLNLEAEKMSKKRPLVNKAYLDYLQRLKLSRRAIEKKNKESKDGKNSKKKTVKAGTLKAKWGREPKVETPPPPEEPRRTSIEFVKAAKIIQSFRYSYAIDDYFNGRSRRSYGSIASSDSVDNELKNGWMIQSLGSNVLNMQMRALPSCNPFEQRKRRQMLRARAEEETRLMRRTSINTNDSMNRRPSRVHFQDPVSSLHSIYERPESIYSDIKSDSDKTDKLLW